MQRSVVHVSSVLLAMILVVAVLSGCSGEVSFTTASLSEATMCAEVDSEYRPVNPTTEFGVNTPEIYCSVKLSNAPDDTAAMAQWVYVRGEAQGVTDYVIDEVNYVGGGTGYIGFSLSRPDGGWPVGEYVVNLFVDGKEKESVPFTVSATAGGPGAGGASITSATMTLEVDAQSKPTAPTSSFEADTPEITCSVLVSNAPAGTELLSEWYYVSGEWQGASNVLVGSVPYVTQGTQYIALSLIIPDEGWPVGQYQVKLYLNGTLQEAVPFSIEAAPITAVMSMSVDKDNNPVNPTTIFPVGVEKVYTVIRVKEAPAGAKLLAEWYDVGSSVHRLISKYEMDLKVSERPTWVSSSYGSGGWPAGHYAVVLSVNGERQVILPFTVE